MISEIQFTSHIKSTKERKPFVPMEPYMEQRRIFDGKYYFNVYTLSVILIKTIAHRFCELV